MSDWRGDERRHIDSVTLQMMAEVRIMMAQHEKQESAVFDELKAGIQENRVSSERRHDEMSERFAAMQQSTMALLRNNNQTVNEIHKMFKTAFPEGDAESHRRAHEAWIEKEKSEREFWLKTKQHVTQWGIVVVLGWAGLILWAGFLKGPGG
jgi:hypothetical protein